MDDYKELLERLECKDGVSACKHLKKYDNSCVFCTNRALLDAAKAIKTILAERETLRAKPEPVKLDRSRCRGGIPCGYWQKKWCFWNMRK